MVSILSIYTNGIVKKFSKKVKIWKDLKFPETSFSFPEFEALANLYFLRVIFKIIIFFKWKILFLGEKITWIAKYFTIFPQTDICLIINFIRNFEVIFQKAKTSTRKFAIFRKKINNRIRYRLRINQRKTIIEFRKTQFLNELFTSFKVWNSNHLMSISDYRKCQSMISFQNLFKKFKCMAKAW